jgi:putative heme-binding domain-containing protein
VTYSGPESTAAAAESSTAGADLRAIRHRLEALHRDDAADAVQQAWPYMGHADRNIRFAARIAIEHRPVDEWANKALNESSSVDAQINALLALARNGDSNQFGLLLGSMSGLAGVDITTEQRLAAMRVLSLAFIRMGRPDESALAPIAQALNEHYPSQDSRLNRELCAMLVYLQDDQVAAKTLPLMETSATQEEQMHFALCLRVLKNGWTNELRERYYRWFLTSASLRGGNSFGGFLKNIREESLQTLSDSERQALSEVLALKPEPAEPVVEASSRPFVKEWEVDDLLNEVQQGLDGRNFENGRRMFVATACYKCHRFSGQGGIVGPDLTGVARRFNAKSLLESMIEPSKVVSDQYEATVFLLDNGTQVIGRVVNLNGDTLLVSQNMLDPGNLTGVNRNEVEEMFVSKTSMMPKGLLNTLTRDDVLDLVAYLQSGGDPSATVFATAP